jgi:GNAT superfamily N-acetyltransferase
MMVDEAARLATVDDLEAIAAIAAAVASETEEKRGGSLFLRRESGGDAVARARGLVESEDGYAVIGSYDEVPFGYALVEVETLADGGRLARIDDLAVQSEARGSGIGEAIMNLVLDEATSRSCFGVDSRALPGDRETKNFFESFGLKARLLVVHRALS